MKITESKPSLKTDGSSSTGLTMGRSHSRHRIAWIVLFIALAASSVGWWISLQHARLSDSMQFHDEVERVRARLVERMSIYENALQGAVGLFAASETVEPLEWRAYVESISAEQRFPGLDALGFIQQVKPEQLEAFEEGVRRDGMPNFKVSVSNAPGDLMVIKYLEPVERFGSLVGQCINDDPNRVRAMERSRDNGVATLTGQIRMDDGSHGFLLMLPVYQSIHTPETLAEKQADFMGVVYARFVMDRFMQEVMGESGGNSRVRIIDTDASDGEKMLFDSAVGASAPEGDREPEWSEDAMLRIGGRNWTLAFDSTPRFEANNSRLIAWMGGIGGLTVSILLFGIAWSLSQTRERAELLAERMTGELRVANEQLKREIADRESAQQLTRDSESLYHSLVESLPLSIYRKDLQGRFTFANKRFCSQLDCPLEEILNRTEFDLFPSAQAALHKQEEERMLESGTGMDVIQELDFAGQGTRVVEVIKTPLNDSLGNIIGQQGIFWDITEKHRIEKELQQERKLLHTLLDNVPDQIYFKDQESRFVRVSRAMMANFKLEDVSDIVGKTDFDFFGEAHARQAYDDEQRIIQTGKPVIGLIEKEDLPDGTHRWAWTTKMPMRDEEGRVIGTFGISRDISRMKEAEDEMRQTNARLQREIADREQAQQSLRNSEALYHSLVESLPLSIFRKDLEGRYTFANQRFCNELGKKLEDILGKPEGEVFPSDQTEQHQQEEAQVIEEGKSVDTVQELTLSPDETRFVQVIKSPLFDSAGNIIGVQGILLDITDKYRMEAELRRERQLLHTLLDNVPDRIYFKDSQSRFVRINRAHARLFKLSHPREAVGKSDFDFFTKDHAKEAFDAEQRIIQTGEPIIGLVEKATLPGEKVRWNSTTKMPFQNEDGEIVGTFGITRDITEMKVATEALREAKEAAEEANRTKSQFLANMSHELRTPLNSIIGFSNILMKNKSGNLVESDLSFLNRILANGKHLLELINQILDLSKIEARKLDLEIEDVQLDDLVKGILVQMEGQLHGRSLELKAEIPANLRPIRTDLTKLKQVIINLVGNALKFTEIGNVTVRVIADSASGQPKGLEVQDTGIGIAEDKLKKVFEAFAQAEGGTSRRYGGTGLGLTISKSICDLLGFELSARSQPGKGSTFTITFARTRDRLEEVKTDVGASPERDQPEQIIVESVPQPRAGGKGKRVLVIDDEEDARMLMRELLVELGCVVTSANSGEEGLALARANKPDLITTDLLMPGMNGWDVIKEISADPQLKSIPVVVVSIVGNENRSSFSTSVDIIDKPVSREALSGLLQRRLAARATVLVVDDDPDSVQIVKNYLEDSGVRLLTAQHGEQALSILEESNVDIIILDLLMPVMDGLTFLSAVQKDARFRDIPVVILTSKSLSGKERQSLPRQTLKVIAKTDCSAEELRQLFRQVWEEDPPTQKES